MCSEHLHFRRAAPSLASTALLLNGGTAPSAPSAIFSTHAFSGKVQRKDKSGVLEERRVRTLDDYLSRSSGIVPKFNRLHRFTMLGAARSALLKGAAMVSAKETSVRLMPTLLSKGE